MRTQFDFEFTIQDATHEEFAEFVAEGLGQDHEGRFVVFVHTLEDDEEIIDIKDDPGPPIQIPRERVRVQP